ncbi:MAG: NUDIX domain-containing protein [Patescibacteria group bacterium]
MPHLHDKIDFTVDVYLVYKDKVLLRMHDKYKKWFTPGGHIELDEDPNQAAIREVKEEVGMDIELYDGLLTKPIIDNDGSKELIPPYFIDMHPINETHSHISLIYFAKAPNDKINEMVEREKSQGIKWFTKREIEDADYILPRIKKYALRALGVLGEM